MENNTSTAYRWCLTCRRAYPADQVRVVNHRLRCAYVDCPGLYHASIRWAYLRTLLPDGVRLPEVPKIGQVYSLSFRDGQLYWAQAPP